MADLSGKTINELPQATSLSDSDIIAVSQGGAAKHITWSSIKSAISSAFTTASINATGLFGGSVTGISSAVGKKSFNTVDAYITFNSSISSGNIATIVSAYRPAHDVCFPLFSASSSSSYAPIGAMWIYSSSGTVQLSYSERPGWAYINYLI